MAGEAGIEEAAAGRAVEEVEHLWVPMPDGVRLAARLWRPAPSPGGGAAAPVPAILEAIPYGKRWGTRWRDDGMHPRFARRGLAVLRLDVRGSGDSEGTLDDEYSAREQADLDAAIAWTAAQPWCDGRVLVLGKSWGGFAALQAAARRPPALGGAVTVCASDDRYAIDAHYMGGCLLVENLIWGASLLTLAAEPPDPALVGDAWRETWHRRLAAVRPFAATWLEHPWRDGYWRHGSVADRPEAIECPVLAIGGWADAYADAVPRLLAALRGPGQGVVGPWAHRYPHNGVPGPPVDFVELVAGWLGRQLEVGGGGEEEAASDPEPVYRVWMAERRPPVDFLLRWPGRWVAEEEWPSSRIEQTVWRLAGERLVPEASSSPNGSSKGGTWRLEGTDALTGRRVATGGDEAGAKGGQSGLQPARARPDSLGEPFGGDGSLGEGGLGARMLRPAESVGRTAGSWCPFGYGGDLPIDQGEDDRRSLVWESEPLAERTEVLGAPEVELRLAVDRPAAFVAVRLVDVAADGSAARITYGLLNLAHRDGHEAPQPLVPGEPFAVRLALRHVAWAVPAGHRLRLAVSTAYWPIAWPSPEPVTLRVCGGALRVPVRPPRAADDLLPPLPPWPEEAIEPSPDPERDPAEFGCEQDAASGDVCHHWRHGFAAGGGPEMDEIAPIGLEVGHAMAETARVRDDDPLSAEVEIEHRLRLRRAGWEVSIETRTRMTATAEHFRLRTWLVAREGGRLAAERSWDQRIPRRLV